MDPTNQLQWLDWERYSARQGSRMLPGGLVGNISFTQGPPEFYSLLGGSSYTWANRPASDGEILDR